MCRHGEEEIKSDEELKTVPVEVIKVSDAEADILRPSYLHSKCCITKPMDLNQFSRGIKSMRHLWLSILNLPPNGKVCTGPQAMRAGKGPPPVVKGYMPQISWDDPSHDPQWS